MKKRNLIILTIAVLLVLFLLFYLFILHHLTLSLGGYSFKTELSSNNPHWGGYKYNQEYILREDVFLQKNGKTLSLVPGASSKFISPYYLLYNLSIKDYKKGENDIILNDGFEKIIMLGIIRNGTTIVTTKLIEDYIFSLFFGGGTTYEVYGRIVDGEFAGTKINDFKGVSIFQPGRLVDIKSFSPNEELLKIKGE